jgi:hypothetical protein
LSKSPFNVSVVSIGSSTTNRFSLEKIYMSFIRLILEYADVIWDSQNQSLINKLENVQLGFLRVFFKYR